MHICISVSPCVCAVVLCLSIFQQCQYDFGGIYAIPLPIVQYYAQILTLNVTVAYRDVSQLVSSKQQSIIVTVLLLHHSSAAIPEKRDAAV